MPVALNQLLQSRIVGPHVSAVVDPVILRFAGWHETVRNEAVFKSVGQQLSGGEDAVPLQSVSWAWSAAIEVRARGCSWCSSGRRTCGGIGAPVRRRDQDQDVTDGARGQFLLRGLSPYSWVLGRQWPPIVSSGTGQPRAQGSPRRGGDIPRLGYQPWTPPFRVVTIMPPNCQTWVRTASCRGVTHIWTVR